MLRSSYSAKLCSGDFYDGSEPDPEPYQWKSGFFIKFCLIWWLVAIPFVLLVNYIGTKKKQGFEYEDEVMISDEY